MQWENIIIIIDMFAIFLIFLLFTIYYNTILLFLGNQSVLALIKKVRINTDLLTRAVPARLIMIQTS